MIDIVDAMTTEQIPFYFANKINESVFDFLSLEVFPKEITKSIFFLCYNRITELKRYQDWPRVYLGKLVMRLDKRVYISSVTESFNPKFPENSFILGFHDLVSNRIATFATIYPQTELIFTLRSAFLFSEISKLVRSLVGPRKSFRNK